MEGQVSNRARVFPGFPLTRDPYVREIRARKQDKGVRWVRANRKKGIRERTSARQCAELLRTSAHKPSSLKWTPQYAAVFLVLQIRLCCLPAWDVRAQEANRAVGMGEQRRKASKQT